MCVIYGLVFFLFGYKQFQISRCLQFSEMTVVQSRDLIAFYNQINKHPRMKTQIISTQITKLLTKWSEFKGKSGMATDIIFGSSTAATDQSPLCRCKNQRWSRFLGKSNEQQQQQHCKMCERARKNGRGKDEFRFTPFNYWSQKYSTIIFPINIDHLH